MSDITTAFWGMTINNYDETDLALVKQGYPDYIRQIVYTLEKGEETGTPHIQAYVKLYRQQRLSYVKKLFPRGNFKALTNDEYKLNAQRYAQKLDGTAQSPATITNNPFPDAVNELMAVIESAEHWWGDGRSWTSYTQKEWVEMIRMEQHSRVKEKPHLAKFYISAQYKSLVKEYLTAFVSAVFSQKSGHTHTHTHTDEKFSRGEGITNATRDAREDNAEDEQSATEDEEDGESYEDGSSETDEGPDESTGDFTDEEDAEPEYGEQGGWTNY